MPPLTKIKQTEAPKRKITKIFLPLYVVLSALFIIYIGYSYLQGVVYTSGASLGQQQGYEAAYVEIMQAVSQTCESMTLTAGEAQINIINVACFNQVEQASSENPTVTPE